MLLKEEARDLLSVISHLESSTYSHDFEYLEFAIARDQPQNAAVDKRFRQRICEWVFEVIDYFNFDREVVSMALYYLDRVADSQTKQTNHQIRKREYQLVAVTSLYLAMKLHGEGDWRKCNLDIESYARLSNEQFSIEMLEAKELEILEILEWKLHPPSAAQVVALLLSLVSNDWQGSVSISNDAKSLLEALYEIAIYLTELATMSMLSFRCKPSEIAFAAILCGMDAVQNHSDIPSDIRFDFIDKIVASTNLTFESVSTVYNSLQDSFLQIAL